MKDTLQKFGNLHVLFNMVENDLRVCCSLLECLEFDSTYLSHVMNEGFNKMEIQNDGGINFEFEKGGDMKVVNIEYERILALLDYLREENDIDRELNKRKN